MARFATLVFFVYIVLEGALRKWALPEFSNELFALKDIILGFAFVAWLTSRDSVRVALQPGEIVLWGAWLVLTVAYAALGGFTVESLVGLRYYLAPLPLLYLVPAMLRDMPHLNRLAVRYLWIALAIAVLGTYQYLSPVDSAINRYAWRSEVGELIAGFGLSEDSLLGVSGDRPRITGSFSFISPYAVFLQAVWFIAWVMLLQSTRRSKRLFAAVTLVAILVNIAMTGSRAPLFLSLVLAVPFAVMALRTFTGFWYQLLALVAFLAIPYLSVSLLFEPFQAILERDEGAADAVIRILGALLTPLSTFDAMQVLGEGISTSFRGLQEFGRATVAKSSFDEIFHDRIGIELGVLGYVLVLVIKLTMITKAFLLSLEAMTKRILYWAIAALCYQLSFGWQIPVYNSVAAIFYFSAIGLVYWLRAENEKVVREVAGDTWYAPARGPLARRS